MKVEITNISFQSKDDETTAVAVTFNGYDADNSLNITTTFRPEHAEEGKTLDDYTRKEFGVMARKRVASWFE